MLIDKVLNPIVKLKFLTILLGSSGKVHGVDRIHHMYTMYTAIFAPGEIKLIDFTVQKQGKARFREVLN